MTTVKYYVSKEKDEFGDYLLHTNDCIHWNNKMVCLGEFRSNNAPNEAGIAAEKLHHTPNRLCEECLLAFGK